MKKFIACALTAALALCLTACGAPKTEPTGTQLPNPFTEYTTMQEAGTAMGFDLAAPNTAADVDQTAIRANKDSKFIEVLYGKDDQKVTLRKGKGAEDISGDYNKYEATQQVDVAGINVTMKGDKDTVGVATWTNGDYTYAVDCTKQIGKDAMVDLVTTIVEAEAAQAK